MHPREKTTIKQPSATYFFRHEKKMEMPKPVEDAATINKKYVESFVKSINQVNASPRDHTGVWYPNDFEKYCQEKKIEFKDDYETGYTNPAFWNKTGRMTFELKPGKKPSEAIRSFLTGFTVTDCGNIIVACQYAALLDVLGDEKFDLLFADSNLEITQKIYSLFNPVSCFVDFMDKQMHPDKGTLGNRPIKQGEMCHIGGLPYYPVKHPAGHLSGWNVIYVGKNDCKEDLFIGFGPEVFKEKPLTEREMYKIMIDDFNKARTKRDEQIVSSAKRPILYDMKHHHVADKVTLETGVKDVQGFWVGSTIGADYAKIERFLKMDKSQLNRSLMAELSVKAEDYLLNMIESRDDAPRLKMR